jgi:hypothetical protein
MVSNCSWISVTSWKRRPFSLISFSGTRYRKGQIRRVRRVGDHSHVFSGQKSLHRQNSVRRRIVMVKQPVLVPPSFRKFSADLLPQTLQNLQVVMLVHRLVWRYIFLVNSALTVKKKSPTYSWYSVTESCFFTRFRCSFPELRQNFVQMPYSFISHFTYSRKSQISIRTIKTLSLRSNTKGYGGKTH